MPGYTEYDFTTDKDRQLTLSEVISFLQDQNPRQVVVNGFSGGHSHRAYNEELAFSSDKHIQVEDILRDLMGWLGKKTMSGHKGGTYPVSGGTLCNLAEYGECGTDEEDHLTIRKLEAMMRGK